MDGNAANCEREDEPEWRAQDIAIPGCESGLEVTGTPGGERRADHREPDTDPLCPASSLR
jgi:hypothetical protein